MTRPSPQRMLADLFVAGMGSHDGALSGILLTASDKYWDRLLAVASEQYVLPVFAASLVSLDLATQAPGRIGEFAAAIRAANIERNEELHGQLLEVVRLLDRIGVRPVLLKGAIRLVDDLYPDIGWRTLRDLDLLIPASALTDSVAALDAYGYSSNADGEWATTNYSHHHYPRLFHPSRLAPIELHTELFAHARDQQILSASAVLKAAIQIPIGNAVLGIPTLEHQLTHLIGHCQISNRGYACGRIALRDALEAKLLLGRPGAAAALAATELRFATSGVLRVLTTFVAFLARLRMMPGDYPMPPLDVVSRLQGHRLSIQSSYRLADEIGWWLGWHSVLMQKLAVQSVCACRRAIAEFGG